MSIRKRFFLGTPALPLSPKKYDRGPRFTHSFPSSWPPFFRLWFCFVLLCFASNFLFTFCWERPLLTQEAREWLLPPCLPHSPAWLHSFPIYVVLRVDVASTLRNFPPKKEIWGWRIFAALCRLIKFAINMFSFQKQKLVILDVFFCTPSCV